MVSALLKSLADYLAGPVFFTLIFLGLRAGIYIVLEGAYTANPVPHRKVWWRDALAWSAFSFMIVPAAAAIDSFLHWRLAIPPSVLRWPFLLRFSLYFVITDFAYYWVHRLMHTKYVWRIHKWHHTPTYMYWFAGVRGSLLQMMLVNLPFLVTAALVDLAPPLWIGIIAVVKGTLQNDWMHLNVRWGNKWLEWVLVTPRYHHIHHSADPAHYGSNIAVTFTLWDRLFGTYVDPARVSRPLTFGIGEKIPLIRLALGV